jgi:hypothetical protein
MDSRFSRVEKNNYFDFPVPDRTLATVIANQNEYHEGYVPCLFNLLFKLFTHIPPSTLLLCTVRIKTQLFDNYVIISRRYELYYYLNNRIILSQVASFSHRYKLLTSLCILEKSHDKIQ